MRCASDKKVYHICVLNCDPKYPKYNKTPLPGGRRLSTGVIFIETRPVK